MTVRERSIIWAHEKIHLMEATISRRFLPSIESVLTPEPLNYSSRRQQPPNPVPRVLMITTRRWPLGGHICIALAKVGFDVAVISPPKSPLRAIDVITSHFKYGRFAPLSSIERAIATASPDLLICADDWAVAHLHRIYDRASKSPRSKSLANLIETSLGDPAGFRTAETMTGLIGLAQSEQLPCPKTTIVSSNGMLEKALQHATYPVLLKGDG